MIHNMNIIILNCQIVINQAIDNSTNLEIFEATVR